MTNNQKLYGALAEFDNVDSIMNAAHKVRDKGFTKWDVHTPFPIHGMDDAMGVRPTILPWLVLIGGFVGLGIAFLMQWWMNAVDYPFQISGKPMFGIPAAIPVAFELTVLIASLTAVFGMLILNGLPKWFHPLFRVERFSRATNDRFYLVIEGSDASFDNQKTISFLDSLGAVAIETVAMPDESTALPVGVKRFAWVFSALVLLPPTLAFTARHTTSETPRLHLVPNMDFQDKYKPQNSSPLSAFADGRAMRLDESGTVARGELHFDSAFLDGKDDNGKWVSQLPVAASKDTLERGRERYDIYCATCHGVSGHGDGAVSQRATELAMSGKAFWVKPTDLTEQRVVDQPHGQIVNTITNGINTMPGYRQQIPAKDRWAIAFYLKALQRAQQ